MTVPQKVVSELQGVAPTAIIELFELKLTASLHGSDDFYRFHAGVNGKNNGGAIVWDGQTFSAYPVEATGFAYTGDGQLPRPKLRVSNQLGLITAILLTVNDPVSGTPGNDLLGAKLTRYRVLAKHIDATNFTGGVNPFGTPDPTATLPTEVYYIARKTLENRDLVEFELASSFDLAGVRAPRRACIPNICNWVYKSAECGYVGDAYFKDDDSPTDDVTKDVCSKKLTGCEARFAPVAVSATVTSGSDILSGLNSTELSKIGTGDPIFGHGIPSGTTVESKSSSSLTMSANATSSTTFTRTGTLGSTGVTLSVSSATDIAVGMTVSGANIPSNTTITAISGTTLTLSIGFNPNIFGSLVTVPATVYKPLSFVAEKWLISDTSGIKVGDYAGNANDVTAENPQGKKVYAGTKVAAKTSDVSVTLDKATGLADGRQITANFWTPVTFSSATYTFTASTAYTIRADNVLPYGSFPGVGGYY